MKKRIAGAPKFPRGLVKNSPEYKEWAAAYARAKRAANRQRFEEAEPSKMARAALDLLLDLADFYKRGEAKIQIPERLWPSFVTLLQRSGHAATIQETDVLRRVVSE
jgi:hypothetical protein